MSWVGRPIAAGLGFLWTFAETMYENHRSSALGALISEAVAPKLNVKKANTGLGEAAVTKRPILIQWLKEGRSLILSFAIDWIDGVAPLQAIIQGQGSFYSVVLPLQ